MISFFLLLLNLQELPEPFFVSLVSLLGLIFGFGGSFFSRANSASAIPAERPPCGHRVYQDVHLS